MTFAVVERLALARVRAPSGVLCSILKVGGDMIRGLSPSRRSRPDCVQPASLKISYSGGSIAYEHW